MLYFLEIAYNGTAYNGWQRQINGIGIQQVIEDTLETILRERCVLIGCGRTDAGVHASQYFAHLRLTSEPLANWQHRLNKMLPKDISILAICQMEGGKHAQHDATERTYRYFIHLDPDPFLAPFSSYYELDKLNMGDLQQCINEIQSASDFRAFCKQPDKVNHTLCEIYQCTWEVDESGKKMRFKIRANRFLRGMVRLLVGNLLMVLNGNLSAEQFIISLQEQEPLSYFNMAHPQGLFLVKVKYPYLDELSPNFKTDNWLPY